MKCSICSKKVEETFLKKIVGTYVKKKGSSKNYPICFECQKQYKTKEEIIKNLK